MAQGKLKVKSKGGSLPPSKKKHEKKAQGIKKGKLSIAPKKVVRSSCPHLRTDILIVFQQHQEAYKFKKNVQKLINAKNEKETKEKAQNFDKKEFLTVNKEAGASKNWFHQSSSQITATNLINN